MKEFMNGQEYLDKLAEEAILQQIYKQDDKPIEPPNGGSIFIKLNLNFIFNKKLHNILLWSNFVKGPEALWRL